MTGWLLVGGGKEFFLSYYTYAFFLVLVSVSYLHKLLLLLNVFHRLPKYDFLCTRKLLSVLYYSHHQHLSDGWMNKTMNDQDGLLNYCLLACLHSSIHPYPFIPSHLIPHMITYYINVYTLILFISEMERRKKKWPALQVNIKSNKPANNNLTSYNFLIIIITIIFLHFS